MRPIRRQPSNDNDWVKENERQEFKDSLRRQTDELMLNPPRSVKIWAGILAAVMITFVVVVFGVMILKLVGLL